MSALVRKNEIRGEKKGGSWFTTEEEIRNYIFKQKVRHKKWIVKYFLLLTKKINRSFVYALICLGLFLVGLYFYNKIGIQTPPTKEQPVDISQPEPSGELNQLQF
ncbi:MAG TPA: hypothetical protein VHA30_05040 [Patescibacteria group bacterium]|nr:hypothetical protein [Patescibacteria group bacterium]